MRHVTETLQRLDNALGLTFKQHCINCRTDVSTVLTLHAMGPPSKPDLVVSMNEAFVI